MSPRESFLYSSEEMDFLSALSWCLSQSARLVHPSHINRLTSKIPIQAWVDGIALPNSTFSSSYGGVLDFPNLKNNEEKSQQCLYKSDFTILKSAPCSEKKFAFCDSRHFNLLQAIDSLGESLGDVALAPVDDSISVPVLVICSVMVISMALAVMIYIYETFFSRRNSKVAYYLN
ncbi:Oidioi.mRNA.OKI2018_I69.chr2.g5321.t1.cds [Oikopleura dioica]|uniref:Oidioi.mRNA.OKI2018_I69.chr2.g5321.t1.cds n=1 Tax=Oikopleura dioica TaxID=34765 RepID=A0ABN7T3C2_OIKDI|nr:Oidioi.mRNA.OKI2018_I69.chr2.g5321.t1.cds [Oikopleura dioica]